MCTPKESASLFDRSRLIRTFPSASNEINPLSNSLSKLGVKSRPLKGSNRSAFVTHLHQGTMWEATRAVARRVPETLHAPHIEISEDLKAP